MIKLDGPLKEQVERQKKIIDALVNRLERSDDFSNNTFSMFQSAITLQAEVWEKTRDLEQAQTILGKTEYALKSAHLAQEQSQKNLAEILETMEEGFALFSGEKLQICNHHFKTLLPDVTSVIQPGLEFEDYVEAVSKSKYLYFPHADDRKTWRDMRITQHAKPFSSFVLQLQNDRWYQISDRHTGYGSVAVLQTDITDIVREKRREKDKLIDDHATLMQAAFDQIDVGIATFSAKEELQIYNARFADYLLLPLNILKKGTSIDRILTCIRGNRIILESTSFSFHRSLVKAIRDGNILKKQIHRSDGMVLELRIERLADQEIITSVKDITIETEAALTLKRSNEILEERVTERTEDLTRANQLLREQYAHQATVEEELRLAVAAAEKADLSKTRYLAAASHDLLQPIAAAKIYISTLQGQASDDETVITAEKLERTFSSVETLLRALLDIARLDSSGPNLMRSTFPIQPILTTLVDDFAPLAAKKHLRLIVVNSSLWVESDQHYLLRIIQNLVANAIEYTNKGKILVGVRQRRNKALIQVWDTGIGISEHDKTTIFEEFKRVGRSDIGGGIGLGLSIVERACRHLGHHIHLQSEPKKGSLFSIELPLRLQQLQSKKQFVTRETEEPKSNIDLLIMLVENNTDVLDATQSQLESWGASVFGVGSTKEALIGLDDLGLAPDILLVDYHLDDSDNGVNTIRKLRAVTKTTLPAIMITADQSTSLVELGEREDFSVLNKPVQLSRLRSLLAWKTRKARPTMDQAS